MSKKITTGHGILIYLFIIILLFILIGTSSVNQYVKEDGAGFFKGFWHGFTLSVTWILRIFFPSKFGIYEIVNNGIWYDFGFLLGVSVTFGGCKYSTKKIKRR
jgi:hypothetical protein